MGEFLAETADFTEWLIVERDEDLPIILAAMTEGSDHVRCEDVLHTILRKLESTAEEVIDIDASRDIRLGTYFDVYPLDLEEATYSAGTRRAKAERSGDEPPTPKHAPPSN
jgi:hypothetical protein